MSAMTAARLARLCHPTPGESGPALRIRPDWNRLRRLPVLAERLACMSMWCIAPAKLASPARHSNTGSLRAAGVGSFPARSLRLREGIYLNR